MNKELNVIISIPTDSEGKIGRVCSKCKNYFKIKPSTGLKTSVCNCPYCGFQGESNLFLTADQIEYSMSKLMGNVLNNVIGEVKNKFKDLEKTSKNSLINLKIETSKTSFHYPIKYYSEIELETNVICDNCGLNFSIYGVFAKCPDCNKMNAFLMFDKSIEVTKKQYAFISKSELPKEDVEFILSSVLSGCVSAFDALGKEIVRQNVSLFPKQPKNLFQKIKVLNDKLDDLIKNEHTNYDFLIEYFQVRHIYEHNMGVIDEDFIKNIPGYDNQFGRKYTLHSNNILKFIYAIEELKIIIQKKFEN